MSEPVIESKSAAGGDSQDEVQDILAEIDRLKKGSKKGDDSFKRKDGEDVKGLKKAEAPAEAPDNAGNSPDAEVTAAATDDSEDEKVSAKMLFAEAEKEISEFAGNQKDENEITPSDAESFEARMQEMEKPSVESLIDQPGEVESVETVSAETDSLQSPGSQQPPPQVQQAEPVNQGLSMQVTGDITINLTFESFGKSVQILSSGDSLCVRTEDGAEFTMPLNNELKKAS